VTLLQLQRLLIPLNISQISWASLTPELDNRENGENRFFLRVPPTDGRLLKNVATLLTYLTGVEGNDINAVNLIYTNTLYGETAAKVGTVFFVLSDPGSIIDSQSGNDLRG